MSQWTHISGSIRYDSIRLKNSPDSDNPINFLGNTCGFDDDEDV